MVVAIAEYQLERPIRSVLDIGCGEGEWRAVLKRLRPAVHYTGVDPSPYVVERFGRRREIVHGAFGDVGSLGLSGPFDLVVCSDVLQFIPTTELRRGLSAVQALLGGLAYLEAFLVTDDLEGDRRHWARRSAADYRRLFREARLTGCGLHCYLPPRLARRATALERAGV